MQRSKPQLTTEQVRKRTSLSRAWFESEIEDSTDSRVADDRTPRGVMLAGVPRGVSKLHRP